VGAVAAVASALALYVTVAWAAAASPAAGAAETSANWGGYAAVAPGGSSPITFTSVSGSWRQATTDCSGVAGSGAASAVWVGLGGYQLDSRSLEQIGTGAECDASGAPSYYAWYELVPGPLVKLPLTVAPGDLVTGSVSVSGGTVLLQLRNRTRKTSIVRRLAAGALDLSSAEWIAEAPASCVGSSCTTLPLANFGTVTFSAISAVGNATTGSLTHPFWNAVPLMLVPRTGPGTSAPTTPVADGKSFSVSWLRDGTANAAAG
jgi:hypothetical protein